MDSAKLNDWMQVIGIFAVVASLIFVGLEMRQSQKIALSAAYQARADSSMSLRLAPLASETLQTAYAKVIHGEGFESLTPEELVVLRGRWNAGMVYVENMHFQFDNGFITEEQWQSNRSELTGYLGWNPAWREDILQDCNNYRESFCAEIRAAAAQIDSNDE